MYAIKTVEQGSEKQYGRTHPLRQVPRVERIGQIRVVQTHGLGFAVPVDLGTNLPEESDEFFDVGDRRYVAKLYRV